LKGSAVPSTRIVVAGKGLKVFRGVINKKKMTIKESSRARASCRGGKRGHICAYWKKWNVCTITKGSLT